MIFIAYAITRDDALFADKLVHVFCSFRSPWPDEVQYFELASCCSDPTQAQPAPMSDDDDDDDGDGGGGAGAGADGGADDGDGDDNT